MTVAHELTADAGASLQTTEAGLPPCRSCGAEQLAPVLSLGMMPLTAAMRRPEQRDQPEARYPLDVAFCQNCSLTQITHSVPPEAIFNADYPYYSSFSDELLRHSRENALSLIASRNLGPSSLVVELASNDGYLLKNFVEAGVPVLGIDPSEGPAKAAIAAGIPTLCEFFGQELAARLVHEGKRADVIIANNVLAHVPDLNGFVRGIATLLKDDGVAVIEAPYVRDMIDKCEFDTIYHEHLCYFSVTALAALFRRHGLSLNHIEHYPIHGGSLRLFVGRRDQVSDTARGYLREEQERGLTDLSYYLDFSSRVAQVKRELTDLVLDLKRKGERIAAYGAAAKGMILLNYVDLPPGTVDYVVDRSTVKQGRLMPGLNIPVHEPERLLRDMPGYTVLLSWNFKDEILRQQDAYLRAGGHFIVPIPRLQVV